MNKELKYVMLIDDDHDDNFFHEKAIKENNEATIVLTKNSGMEALAYLKSKNDNKDMPDLIFLDINMPRMNGWEFLEEYNLLDKELQSPAVIIMLTTSGNPDDIARAKTWRFVSDYITKPLTHEIMDDIIHKYFE